MSDYIIKMSPKTARIWNDELLNQRLENLADANKKTTWIRGNLSTAKSCLFGRIFWCVAKHFDWMRRYFYDIDLTKSKKILQELQPQILKSDNSHTIELYKKAVENFNTIAPRHQIPLNITLPAQKKTMSENENAEAIINKSFHGDIGFDKTQSLLANKPPGTFLIRNSASLPGGKVIAFVSPKTDGVKQSQLIPKGSGYTFKDESLSYYFNSLANLLSIRISKTH